MQIAAEHSKLTFEVYHLRSQCISADFVPGSYKSVIDVCERPAKRANVARWCGDFSRTTFLAASEALLVGPDEFGGRCEALTLKRQCILALAKSLNELRGKVAGSKTIEAVAKDTSKGCKEKRDFIINKLEVELDAKLSQTKASHMPLVGIATPFKASAKEG